ncbi:MAG: cytochrome P450 [Deltaproteobacteria bacterium]|nr:MAG: cytochrome P450 [Deltaproteobacteria bacterium]
MKTIKMNSKEFVQNSHETLAWLRENSPVSRLKLSMFRHAYLITRYDDVKSLLSDKRLVKDPTNVQGNRRARRAMWIPKFAQPLMNNMLTMDDPDHRRLRSLVQQAFTPKRVASLAPIIQSITNRLLEQCLQKGSIDFVESFALPLPVEVIARLVGVSEEDLPQFFDWVHRIMKPPSPLGIMSMIRSIKGFVGFIEDLAEQRRRSPQDDLMTGLVQAEEEGSTLSKDELVAMVFLLLTAGHETTVSLLTNGLHTLLRHPEEFETLRHSPESMEMAIEELIRYDGPFLTSELYYAREPISLHGTEIPAAAPVLLSLLSANRDASVFDNPNRLNLTRSPNPHLGFGRGIHYCLGAPLARLEASIALRTLVEQTQNIRLTEPSKTLRFQSMWIVHKLSRLPVTLQGR